MAFASFPLKRDNTGLKGPTGCAVVPYIATRWRSKYCWGKPNGGLYRTMRVPPSLAFRKVMIKARPEQIRWPPLLQNARGGILGGRTSFSFPLS